MNKTTAPVAALLLLLAACGAETDPAQPYRDALPKAQAVQIGTPQTAGGAAGALSVSRQPLGDTASPKSEYAVTSYYLAVAVNGGAGLVLDLVQFVVHLPPTACGDASCTWGPWTGDQGLNQYELVVTKQAGAYGYVLSGRPFGAPDTAWVDLLTGTARPVDRDHGSGTFTLDFDAQHAGLAHGPGYQRKDFGQLAVTYDNTKNVTVRAQFLGAQSQDPADPCVMNAAYAFEAAPSGGELQVAFENLGTTAVVSLRTRWSASGAGRADAHYVGPDGAGGAADYRASECWAGRVQDFVEVYDSKFPLDPRLNDESACSPFASASYADIALP